MPRYRITDAFDFFEGTAEALAEAIAKIPPNQAERQLRRALSYVCMRDRVDLLDVVLGAGAKPELVRHDSPFTDIPEAVQKLLDAGADPNDAGGDVPPVVAFAKNAACLKLLLDAGSCSWPPARVRSSSWSCCSRT